MLKLMTRVQTRGLRCRSNGRRDRWRDPVRQDESRGIPGRCVFVIWNFKRNYESRRNFGLVFTAGNSRLYVQWSRERGRLPLRAAPPFAGELDDATRKALQTHRVCPFSSANSMKALKLIFLSVHLELFRVIGRVSSAPRRVHGDVT